MTGLRQLSCVRSHLGRGDNALIDTLIAQLVRDGETTTAILVRVMRAAQRHDVADLLACTRGPLGNSARSCGVAHYVLLMSLYWCTGLAGAAPVAGLRLVA